jgi:hypothetical protein
MTFLDELDARSQLAGTAAVEEENMPIERDMGFRCYSLLGRLGTVLKQLIWSMLPAQAPYSLTLGCHKV